MNLTKEIAALNRMTVRELRQRYAEVFGDETRTGNKPWGERSLSHCTEHLRSRCLSNGS
jgi:hypothetical protein